MFLLTVRQNNRIENFYAEGDRTIFDILRDNNIILPAICGRRGICGKCAIRLLHGFIEISVEDKAFFSPEKLNSGMRLACTARLTGDTEIYMEAHNDDGFKILSTYKSISPVDPNLYQVHKLQFAALSGSMSKYVRENFSNKELSIALLKKFSGIINPGLQKLYGTKELDVLVRGSELVDVFTDGNSPMPVDAYGIAIDIGTTTICFEMINLTNGSLAAAHSRINGQRRFGADVISRIEASKNNIAELRDCVRKDIQDGIAELLTDSNAAADNIYKIEIAANTTMIHLLLGIPCLSLGVSPFYTTLTDKCVYSFNDIFDSGLCHCDVEILPSVSAYVGSDITAGILFCGKYLNERPSLIIDLGTNGEMALFSRNGILCTAAAAGPAFEGGNISCGTGGIPGAISKVACDDSGFVCESIGGIKPIGICGSGVMDAVACLLKSDLIDETGLLADEFFEEGIELAPGISLNQKDIRELQLAKSAVRSGIEVLLKEAGIKNPALELDAVYIAGSFGYHMNTRSAIDIGLIPPTLHSKLIAIGNSSLGGCVKAMLEGTSVKAVQEIANAAREINLSESALFNELFMEHIGFSAENFHPSV